MSEMRSLAWASGALFACGVVVACSSIEDETASDEAPILNGAASSRREVVLLANREHTGHCRGTLIAPNVVLTAGHCVDEPDVVAVYVDYSRPTKNSDEKLAFDGGTYQKLGVKATAIMPGFRDNGVCPMIGADVALILLDGNVHGVHPAQLADATPQLGDECIVAGYGRHNADEDASSVENDVNDWSYDERREAKVKVIAKDSDLAFSAQGVDGAHSRGDSGGPIFCGGKVAGTVSCSPDRNKAVLDLRKTYGDVFAARAFIDATMQAWKEGRDGAAPPQPDASLPDAAPPTDAASD